MLQRVNLELKNLRIMFLGLLDAGIKLHLDIYESYKYNVYDSHNVLLVGKGVFAGSIFYGSHRLIAVFRSPLTRVCMYQQ